MMTDFMFLGKPTYTFKGVLSSLLIIIWKLLLHKTEFSWKVRTDERGVCSVSHGSGVNLCEVVSCLEEFLLSFFISVLWKHYLVFFSHDPARALPPSLTPVPRRRSLPVSHCSLRGSSEVHLLKPPSEIYRYRTSLRGEIVSVPGVGEGSQQVLHPQQTTQDAPLTSVSAGVGQSHSVRVMRLGRKQRICACGSIQ